MQRTAVFVLFALACSASLAFANEEDAALLDSPLFATSEEAAMTQPQRSLLATTSASSGYYSSGYYGGYNGGAYGGGKLGKDYEVYFIGTTGVIKSKAGKFRFGLYRDRVLIPSLKAVAKRFNLPWIVTGTTFRRCVVKKTAAFTKKRFHVRVVCNLKDINSSSLRHKVRKALRNAAKAPKGQTILIVA